MLVAPPQQFGYKTGWFAIRSADTKAVAEALDLLDLQEANWMYGVWHAGEDYKVFVTPPVNGWTLAVGTPVLFDCDYKGADRAVALSRQFGEAQLFGSMRVSDAFNWVRAVDGVLVRSFYEGDGERHEVGEITPEEASLNLKFFHPVDLDMSKPENWPAARGNSPGEEDVLKIAGVWSVNPSDLPDLGLPSAFGLLGKPGASYPKSRY